MFLRRIRPRGRGRRSEYWVLLESYRTAKGSRHRVVAYLGKLSAQEVSGWEKLAARLDGKQPVMPGLFDPPPSEDECDKVASVDLKHVRLQNIREFGSSVRLTWRGRCGGCWGWINCCPITCRGGWKTSPGP